MPTTGADGLLEKLVSLRPGEAVVLLRAHTTPVQALLGAAEEAERLVISDIGRGLSAGRALVAVADAFGEPAPRARARRALAQALAYSNRFEDALRVLEEGAALADDAAIPLEAALARLAMLHALARQGRYERAVDEGHVARLAFETAGEPVLAARADINLGVTHRMRGDARAALQHFDRARASLDAQPVLLAQLESNRAEALLDLHEFGAAEHAFLSALSAFRRAGMARATAIVEGNLADLAGRQGRLDHALDHFERARRQFGEQESPGDVARLQAEQAEAMSAVGMYGEAVEALRSAIPVLEKHDMAWEAARALTALGRAQVRLEKLDDASASLVRAGSAFEALKHDPGAARVRLAQAEIAARRGEVTRAEELLHAAISAMGERPADVALARLHLAGLALAAGRLDQAVAEIEQGIATAQDLDLAPLLADLLHLRARFHRARGSLVEARTDLRASVAQVERIRGTLQADRFRSAFQSDRMSIYEDSISNTLDLRGEGATAEAFELVERAKGRSLLDLLRGGASLAGPVHGTAVDKAEAAMLADLAGLRGELNALYAQLDDARPRDANYRREWKAAVGARERAIANVEHRLAATRKYSGVFADAIGLKQASALFGPGTVGVEYFADGGDVSAFIFSEQGAEVRRRFASLDVVADRLNALQFQIARAIARALPEGPAGERLIGDARHELARLYDALIAPIEDVLATSPRLVVIPHGPLHQIPFGALSHDGRALVEDREIVYAPSASVLAHLPSRAARGGIPGRSLVVGVSDALAPAAEREARTVASYGPSLALTGPNATIGEVAKQAQSADLIHLATHARFVQSDPLASGIKLADGWLTARDIYGLDLRGAVVVLSGCDTGRAVVTRSDELMGLARAFLVAGASSLLLSLWPVHDQTGQEIMASIYRAWYAGAGRPSGGLAAALRSAQIAAMSVRQHPAAWGPFVLIGSP